MPRAILGILLFGLLIIHPARGLAQAGPDTGTKPLFSLKTDDREPIFGDRFTLKAGYKVWVASWQAPLALPVSQHISSDNPSALHGPSFAASLKLRDSPWFNSLILGGSWMRAGFDFNEGLNASNQRLQNFSTRNDFNLSLGLAVYEGLGIFAGYYVSDQKFTTLISATPTLQITLHSTRNVQGPLFGGFATVPLSDRVAFYGNAAVAFFHYKLGANVRTNSAQGLVSEMGFNFSGPRVSNVGTEFQAGLRAQIIRKNFGPGGGVVIDTSTTDLTYGPIFTINAVF